MKKYFIAILPLILFITVFGDKHGSLEKVIRPDSIDIFQDKLYVVEGAEISLYNLKDLKFIRKFGKAGEGPGELKVNRSVTNFTVPLNKTLLIVGMDKAIEFSIQGQVVKEFKIAPFTNYLHPIGSSYAAMKFGGIEGQDPRLNAVILDKDFNVVKELYSQKLSGGQNMIDLTFDGLNICVWQERIYIEQSPEGFNIGVYDKTGKQLNVIKKDYEKIRKITGLFTPSTAKVPVLARHT